MGREVDAQRSEQRSQERSRASKGAAGRGSAGGTTGGNPAPNAPGGNQYPGYKGPGGTRDPNTSIAPGGYGLSSAEKAAYDAAKTEYQNRGFGKRLVDFLSPIKSVDPQINQPSSYANGQYHHGVNPVGLGAGLAAPYGSGTLLGPLAGSIYSGLGGHDVVLTGPGSGWSTSYPDGGPGYNSSTGYGGPSDPRSPQGKGSQSGNLMSAFGSPAPGGAPFGPQPTAQTGGNPAPAAPTMFAPKIANHSLPKGYESLFPGSLTEEDKKLLYAQALMGGA